MPSQLPRPDAVSIEHQDWSVVEQSANGVCWTTTDDVVVRLQILTGPPPWPFDLTDPQGAMAFLSQEAASLGGVMLSLDIDQAAGLELLRGVFKYRAPIPGSLASYYMGLIILPFREYRIQFNVEAMEGDPTGMREAAVHLLLRKQGTIPPSDEGPVETVGSMDEVFRRMAAAPVKVHAADEEQWDASFPDHALSCVRAKLRHIQNTLQVREPIRSAERYRAKRGWQFWKR